MPQNKWEEMFDEKSKEVNTWMNADGTTYTIVGMSINETKQFISSLRKEDEEALIKGLLEPVNEDEEVYKRATIMGIKRHYSN